MYEVCIIATAGNSDPVPEEYEMLVSASDFVASVLHGDYYPLHTIAAVQINKGSECVYGYVLPDDLREVDAEACSIDMWVEATSNDVSMPEYDDSWEEPYLDDRHAKAYY